jgi:hypothetical protein
MPGGVYAGIFAAPMFAHSVVAADGTPMPADASHRVLGEVLRASVGKTEHYRHRWRQNDLV